MFIGIGGLEAARKLLGRFERPEVGAASKSMGKKFRLAAGLGAAAAIAERAYRYHKPSKASTEPVKQAMVAPAVGGTFKSPALALRKGQQTGMFEAGKIHQPRVRAKPTNPVATVPPRSL